MKLLSIILALFFLNLLSTCSSINLSSQEEKASKAQTYLNDPHFLLNPINYEKLSLPLLEAHFISSLEKAQKRVKEIKSQPASFQNTIKPLESIDKDMSLSFHVISHLKSVRNTEEVNKLYLKLVEKYQTFGDALNFDQILFSKVSQVFAQRKVHNIRGEDLKILEDLSKDFIKNGVKLSKEKQEKLSSLSKRISILSNKYSDNLMKHKKSLSLTFSKAELKGVPDSITEGMKKGDKYILTAVGYKYIDLLKYADSQETRKKVYILMSKVGKENPYNNEKIVREIADLRFKKAKLLGFKSFSDFTIQDRMAKSDKDVIAFLKNLRKKTKKYKEADDKKLEAFANKTNHSTGQLKPWDKSYFARIFKEKFYSVNEEKLKAFFEFEHIRSKVFELAEIFFQVKFKKISLPKFHEGIHTFSVYDTQTDKILGLFYLDIYSRDDKRGGAWMNDIKSQFTDDDGKSIRPHIINVLNISKPAPGKPTLLKLSEVETLMHELGHALHGLLSDVKYASLSGTNVSRDFVEVPSMLFEKFLYQKSFLQKAAKNYQTGEQLDDATIDKIIKAKNYRYAYYIYTQSTYALLDMYWHGEDFKKIKNLLEFEDDLFERTPWERKFPRKIMSLRFSHLFSGGYASGYYSYMWSESFASDGFEYFIKNQKAQDKLAKAYKEAILTKGGTVDPLDAYEKFRGRPMDAEAIVRAGGLK